MNNLILGDPEEQPTKSAAGPVVFRYSCGVEPTRNRSARDPAHTSRFLVETGLKPLVNPVCGYGFEVVDNVRDG